MMFEQARPHHHLVELERVPVVTAVVLERPAAVLEALGAARSSKTPSTDTNSVTTILPIVDLLS